MKMEKSVSETNSPEGSACDGLEVCQPYCGGRLHLPHPQHSTVLSLTTLSLTEHRGVLGPVFLSSVGL